MSAYRPGEAAQQLGIAAPTLRRWSVQFAELLSASASAAVAQHGGALERRYADHDIALLQRAGALLARGMTYDQARRALVEGEQPTQADPLALTIAPDTGRALVELASAQRETIAAQRETIALLRAEIERLSGEHTRQRDRYLGIIKKLIERQR